MPAIFSRVKNWVAEILTYADLNAEIDNILNNFEPAQMDDYSTNAAEMRTTTDPGESGTESLATTLAGELERLRYTIKEIKGDVAQWYTTPGTSLSAIEGALGSSLDPNRILSGLSRSDSGQPVYLVPNGAANTAKVDGDTTNLIYFVDGTSVTVSTEVAISSLSTAPASNNTALVNDTDADDSEATKLFGEYGSTLTVDAMGSEILALTGKTAAFKINNGSADEYFIGRVKSSTEIVECRRGYFFDSSSAPVPRVAIADNDTITLLRITWIFGKNDGTAVKVTAEPVWQADEPTSPVSDDYWYDIENSTWKKYNGASFVAADATFLGIVICDSSNCIGARSLEFSNNPVVENHVGLEKVSATQIRAIGNRPTIGVLGNLISYSYDSPTWDMTLDMESGVTEASSTMYYLYLTEVGDEVISDKIPYDREGDLGGYYHPHHAWRCVGQAYNDSSSDLEEPQEFFGVVTLKPADVSRVVSLTSLDDAYTVLPTDETILIDGRSDDITINLPRASSHKGRELNFKRLDNEYKSKQDFEDGDVTTGTDTINISSHGFVDLEKVRLTNSGGTLPAGLATATDYFIIYTDADNFKLASSRANAVADTAVDITAAAGGGTHTVKAEARAITLDPFSSETIDGNSTLLLYTQDERYRIISDGSNWEILDHYAETEWASAGTLTYGATTTAPTKGATQTHDDIKWRREGDSAHIRMTFRQTSASGAAAGSGDYLYDVTAIGSIDTAKVDVYATTEGWNSSFQNAFTIGTGVAGDGTSQALGGVIAYDASYVRLYGMTTTQAGIVGSAGYPLSGANVFHALNFVVPISSWKA